MDTSVTYFFVTLVSFFGPLIKRDFLKASLKLQICNKLYCLGHFFKILCDTMEIQFYMLLNQNRHKRNISQKWKKRTNCHERVHKGGLLNCA